MIFTNPNSFLLILMGGLITILSWNKTSRLTALGILLIFLGFIFLIITAFKSIFI